MRVRLDTIEIQDPDITMLAEWKVYASISGNEQNTMFLNILRSALKTVGDWHDTSLLDQSLRLTVEDYGGGAIHLYRNPSAISSVKDGDGNTVSYTRSGGGIIPETRGTVVIEYDTEADGDEASMKMKSYRYALAVYDGEDPQVLKNILTER